MKEIINELQIIDTCQSTNQRKSDESRDDRETSLSDLFSNSTSLEDPNRSFTDHDISLAIAKNDESTVAKYLSASGNPNFINSRNHSLLECAFASKNEKIVELLLRAGAGKFNYERSNIVRPTWSVPNQGWVNSELSSSPKIIVN